MPGTKVAKGVSEVLRGSMTPLDEHLRLMDAVTLDDVVRVANQIFTKPSSLVAVGPGDLEIALSGF